MGFFYTNSQYHRGSIYVRGYDTNGKYVSKKVDYQPTIFVPTNKIEESDGWRTIYGDPVKPVKMRSVFDMKEYVNGLDNICGLIDTRDQKYAFINDIIPGEVEHKMDLIKTLIFDIEIETEGGHEDIKKLVWGNPHQKINAICVWINNIEYVSWGLGKFEAEREDHEYREFTDELEMLHDFFKFVQHEKPDIISGWNINGFDIPYLFNRVSFLGKREYANLMSPWRHAPELVGNEIQQYTIPGIAILDYMETYKKFNMTPRESYSLNNICYEELGEKKLDYSEFDSLMDLYKKDWKTFIRYNLRDTELVKKLDDKLKYFDLVVTYAYLGKVNYEDVFGTVKYWDIKIYNHLYKKKIAIPPKPKDTRKEEYPGGFVKDPIVGMHKWVSTFDLNSLYPSVLIQWNISPETLINGKHSQVTVDSILNKEYDNSEVLKEDITLAANGVYFSKKKQGFIPEILEELYETRTKYKKKMLAGEAKLQKVLEEIKRRKL